MRDIKRIPRMIVKLEQLWTKHPDLRLGQLIDNISAWGQSGSSRRLDRSQIFNLEDDEWEWLIDEYSKYGW